MDHIPDPMPVCMFNHLTDGEDSESGEDAEDDVDLCAATKTAKDV